MEDGNFVNANDEKLVPASVGSYSEQSAKTTNGHDLAGEASSPLRAPEPRADDLAIHDSLKKRVNPLKIHLGKRPFVDSLPFTTIKKKPPIVNRSCEPSALPKNSVPRAPKLIHRKKINNSQFQNVASQPQNYIAQNEQDKPVPRLVPKSQLHQFKKSAVKKVAHNMNEYPQNAGLQPMVKFKCRKCCSMSFKTLAMLKEHQQVCRAQAKEPALAPEAAPSVEAPAGGPSRVTRKVYLCSACGTYYENWNLFLHMREVHNRHICLFCLGMFSKAEKLSAHLTNKHNVQEFCYNSKEDFCSVYNGTLYLMCCECDEICSEQDNFFNHDCNNVIPKPVPVLVSKNAAKINNMKQNKICSDSTGNGLAPIKDMKNISNISKLDKRQTYETKPETVTTFSASTPPTKVQGSEPVLDTIIRTKGTTSRGKDMANIIANTDVSIELNSTDFMAASSPLHQPASSPKENRSYMPNGDDSMDGSDRSNSPVNAESQNYNHRTLQTPSSILQSPVPFPTVEKENCGIKLKLSLNKANSPVIINSTVDPTVGQQNAYKPPTRTRRPPKRYEKDGPQNRNERYSRETPTDPLPPKTPSIKMTICDKADSPFVKTTFYENNQETTLKTLLNNNLETASSMSLSSKPIENTAMLSTIYDNKLEDMNTMNRVPKLTVRVPKELLDKDSSSEYSSDSDASDKLTVDDTPTYEIQNEPKEEPQSEPEQASESQEEPNIEATEPPPALEETAPVPEEMDTEPMEAQIDVEKLPEEAPVDEIPVLELKLDRPLDKYPLKELLKVFLAQTVYNCIYCNYVRKVAVNCKQLALHMAAEHRFAATVDSITAEELLPETIQAKLKVDADELHAVFINLDYYDSEEKCETVQYDHMFECFQCYFKTAIHKDLYLHNRKMHQKTILLCVMCKSNFYSYSELLCHLCPGTYDSEYEIKFRCCLCTVDSIPSSFRLMVHLRKIHNACDVCLEFCHNQSRLSNHVWKHKLHHLCYRCGIAYRNKPDITKHLFWKHGTESILCKRCLQKKWPHIYHFCTPPAVFVCEECNLQFTRAVSLKVHKRFHSGEQPHACIEEGCEDKFVSKKLLMKHLEEHQRKLATVDLEEKTDKKPAITDCKVEPLNEQIPTIDLVDDKPTEEATLGTADVKTEAVDEQLSKKARKKKQKEKDALLLDVNLPELNLSESDSSDESDSGLSQSTKEEKSDVKPEVKEEKPATSETVESGADVEMVEPKAEEKAEVVEEDKADAQQVLDIWDNFKKYQAKTETKPREKTPPLVPIRKHVCESDHDYCVVPAAANGDDPFASDKKQRSRRGSGSSSSSSASSCSCGSSCSCSSSSSDSSSDDSSDTGRLPDRARPDRPERPLRRRPGRPPKRRVSTGSNVDVMGAHDTPVLLPERAEPPVAETDLDTAESDTDEDFYDEHPQRLANTLHAEKRNQLMLLASVAPADPPADPPADTPLEPPADTPSDPPADPPSDPPADPPAAGLGRPATPDMQPRETSKKEKSSSKKKSKKKKRSKSKRHEPIKINIPKDFITTSEPEVATQPLAPNKITISLQSNTVQIPPPPAAVAAPSGHSTPGSAAERKRASKRRRVPNKFYGYSSDEEGAPAASPQLALKPQQPPKLEWRKEDLPSPVTHRAKKEVPTTTLVNKMYNSYADTMRLTAPVPDPAPPRILMNTESVESSSSQSSDDGAWGAPPAPPPTYLNSGTSSLPYAFQRPAGRQAREGESVYCYCRCPYDEVSEMIACDADGCSIEWFHFECVGIMVPPKGKWYCPECRKKQSLAGYK